MPADQALVTLAGLGTIVWICWYFFVAGRRRAVMARTVGSAQEVRIIVDGGYAPAAIELQAGRPARLRFDRRDSGSCTEEVVFPDFGIRRFLPSGAVTTVEFTPKKVGSFEFACGMGMVRGKLVVRG